MADEQTNEIIEQATEPHGEASAEIDWKAEARKWEKRAKENKDAADRLNALENETSYRISELEKRAQKAEQEAIDLRHKQDLNDWAKAAADAHGVPASILRGTTAEEFMAHAEAIKASIAVAPIVRDSGEPKEPTPQVDDKSKFVKNLFSNE